MKITTNEEKPIHRYYVMSTVVGWLVMRVLLEDVELFMEGLGEYVVGAGDSPQEAMEDTGKREEEKMKGVGERLADALLCVDDEIRISLADLRDWAQGKFKQ